MVIMKANTKQGRATAEIDFLYLQSSYLLEYMMTMNHALFEDFGFHFNARHLKQMITKCMISTFKHRQLRSSTHIFAYHV